MNSNFLEDVRKRYFLAQHIYYSNVDGHFIVLDLRKNKYLLLGEEEKLVFGALFENEAAHETPDLERSIMALVQKRILTDNPNEGKPYIPPVLAPVTRDMHGYPFDGIPQIRASHVYRCFKAVLYTKVVWWFNSMERVIRKLKKRKERHLAKHPPKVNFEQTRELVEIFRTLRVLFYTAREECLFDSLALVNFLGYYAIYPQMIFGVKMGPFGAHAWVQDGNISYNCKVSQADDFKPIMVV